MAQKIQTLFIDDIDGSEAVGTVRFGLDGQDYEIDLNDEHAEELREKVLRQYVEVARRVNTRAGSGRYRVPAQRGRSSSDAGTEEVRQWAKDHGIDVKDRGRVPGAVMIRFKDWKDTEAAAAAGSPAPEPEPEPEKPAKAPRARRTPKPNAAATALSN